MTDTLPDVVVVGQRRPNGSGAAFPSIGSSGGGGGNNPGGIHQNEIEENPEDPPAVFNPCADPATAEDWNADAAAAEAAKEFARRAAAAGEDGLNTRERGAFLYRGANGQILIGPITQGTGFTNGGWGTVQLDMTGIDPSTIVGSVHSHGAGSHLPSDQTPAGDPGDIQHLEWMASLNAGARLYIVAQNLVGAGQTPYNQVNVYTTQNAVSARSNNQPGPEVNPDAQPCPGA